MINLSIGRN